MQRRVLGAAVALCLGASSLAGLSACGGGGKAGGAPGTAVTPTFDPPGGSYATAQSVTISTATSGATIYYTTDGSDPTTSSARYTAAVGVATSTTLKAIAVAAGRSNSAVGRADYSIQGTEYALPAERTTLWQPGVTYAVATGATRPAAGSAPPGWTGGIPVRTQTCATVTPSGDASGVTDSAAIQSAVDGCPAHQVVKLAPGTFVLKPQGGIAMKSYVTVRGSGAAQVGTAGATFVRCASPGACTLFGFGNWSHMEAYNWKEPVEFAQDAAKGAYGVQLKGATAVAVGEVVSVDEQYDAALTAYTHAAQTCDYLGFGEGKTPGLSSTAACRAASRPIGQAMEVAAIDTGAPYGTSAPFVTFTAPFNRTYRASHAAHLARLNRSPADFVQWAGLEDLTLLNGAAGDGQGNVALYASKYCWVKHVESHGGDILMMHTFRCELRDSFVHTGQTTTYGGGAYGIVIDTYGASNLVENNISWSFNKVMLMRSSGGGNVIGYNYMEDGYGSNYGNCQPDWADLGCSGLPENGLNASHMATPHEELFEGNQAFNGSGDSTWGNSIDITFFRNHFTATRRNIGAGSGTQDAGAEPPHWCDGHWSCAGPVVRLQDDGNRRAAGADQFHYDYSFVGNVLGYPSNYLQTVAAWPGSPYPATFHQGEPGWTSAFAYEVVDGASDDAAKMWAFGPSTLTAGPGSQPGLLRDGNYDYVSQSTHWHGVGGYGVNDGLQAPAVARLPSSLYIPPSMQPPPFFGGKTWPWIDGSNPSNPIPGALPARTRFDAGTPDTLP